MFIFFSFIGFIVIFFLILKKQEIKDLKETTRILKSLGNKKFIDNISDYYKNDYEAAKQVIINQENEINSSIEALKEYKNELELTYNALLAKSKELELSNHVLEQRVASLSNINSLSRTVLSIMDLDKIISTILDAYFILTGAKRISLYLWEGNKLINKRVKGDVEFKGEVSYDENLLNEFTAYEYKKCYSDMTSKFNITADEKIIFSPMNVKGKELGVIFIIEDKQKLLNSNEETISALSIQVAIAINNAQIYSDLLVKERLSKELEVASRIQTRILPKKINKILGLDIATYFHPAKEIGGDYYDYSLLDENTFSMTIADVSGKGVPAAFLMALGRSILKTLEIQNNSPNCNIEKLNQFIYQDITEDMFITMLHSKYSFKSKTIYYSNAGHTPLLVYNSLTKKVDVHSVKGVAIGFLEDYKFKQGEVYLNIGDVALYYTDGITEAENEKKELFGIERVKNILTENASLMSNEIKEKILMEVSKFQNGYEQNDDVTFIVVKREE